MASRIADRAGPRGVRLATIVVGFAYHAEGWRPAAEIVAAVVLLAIGIPARLRGDDWLGRTALRGGLIAAGGLAIAVWFLTQTI